ncbi:MAG: hypothetical protein MR966_13895 [Lachnospiraceae bacterium]|nr:hypothetical protein [Lachnospiraceae bacterium]
MSNREKMKLNGKVVSVEKLHELASDNNIEEINLGDSISGSKIRGCREKEREFDQWELAYRDGKRILVYV